MFILMKWICTVLNGLAILIVVKLSLLFFTGTVEEVQPEHSSQNSSTVFVEARTYSGLFNALAPLLAALGASSATWIVFSRYQKISPRITEDRSK